MVHGPVLLAIRETDDYMVGLPHNKKLPCGPPRFILCVGAATRLAMSVFVQASSGAFARFSRIIGPAFA
jgi:hypothetical protein